ncbi:MAG: hypothetical protein OSW71_18380 [Proteobacteria bacterium]|jgi:hypothetical protein|nr:hypothetical protein [Pseudomonadota bacterium]
MLLLQGLLLLLLLLALLPQEELLLACCGLGRCSPLLCGCLLRSCAALGLQVCCFMG